LYWPDQYNNKKTKKKTDFISCQRAISIQIKKSIVTLLLYGLKSLVIIRRVLIQLFSWLLIKPIRVLWVVLLRPLTIFIYHRYLPIRQVLHRHFGRFKKSWIYPFTTRYVVHFIIIALTILVTTHSLSAREIRTEDFGQGSILSTLIGQDSDEIVETADSIMRQTSYADTRGVLVYAPEPDGSDENSLLATTAGGTSLVKTATPTSSVDREGVAEYAVRGGDTPSTIASSFDISTATILWANDLSDGDLIKPGQILKIPPTSGVIHTIKSGDTVAALAKKYKASVDEILAYNKLAAAEAIEIDQTITIPGGSIEPPPPQPTRLATTGGSIFGGSAPAAKAVSGGGMTWPTVSRHIYQYFTWRHTGIDIDGSYGGPIYAASAGRVSKSSGGWNGGYGNIVIVDHGGGVQTLYAHNSKNYVQVGAQVSKGQAIAATGSTGRSSGPHLHFEVRVGGRRVNPLSYL
jgi:murein DD-endopeptidase MepM/ murein hydrolase activator NlpD